MSVEMIEHPQFPGYFAGADGMIYSNHRKSLKKLSLGVQSSGRYYIFNPKRLDGRRMTVRVHKFICECFHGSQPFDKAVASHKDDDWKNNVPSNLVWETQKENLARKKINGGSDCGWRNSRSLLTEDQIKEMKKLINEGKLTHKKIGEKFGVNRVFVTKVANGHRYAY